ncbi:MAG: hypothetical protein QME40_04305 [bacterium]|nr:hypothetical protein [bacterium]
MKHKGEASSGKTEVIGEEESVALVFVIWKRHLRKVETGTKEPTIK